MNKANDAILQERYGSEKSYFFEDLDEGIKETILMVHGWKVAL